MRLDGTKYTFSHKTPFGDLHGVVLPDVGELAVIPGAEPAHEECLGVGGRDVHRGPQARQEVAGEGGGRDRGVHGRLLLGFGAFTAKVYSFAGLEFTNT